MDLTSRAHLPAVRFSSRAYMGCGAWDLARAPETAIASLESARRVPVGSSFARPRRTMGCGQDDEDEESKLSCGSGGYMPEFMKEQEDELGRRRVTMGRRVAMGCGDDEMCEECKSKMEKQMGCPKCKRVRQRAMMNEELEGARRMGQEIQIPPATAPTIVGLVVAGLTVAGILYFVTR